MMSNEQVVFECSASYYEPSTRKWKTGIFSLNEKCIQFCYDDNQILNIHLKMLSGLEKRQSSLIYPALVVSAETERYWFSSLPNRDSLYNLLELFWRETLLLKEYKKTPERSRITNTNLGKDLLNLIHESEVTLVEAANALSDQGKQIEETQATLININSDLNVAEKFVKNMSFPNSIMKLVNVRSTGSTEQKEPIKCFKVSYTFSDMQNGSCTWNKGTIFLGEKITLVDDNKANQFSVNYNEVVLFQVVSRWKISLVYSIGSVEKSCYIICPQLHKLLRCLNSLPSLNDKISYPNGNISSSSSVVSCSSPSSSNFPDSPLSDTNEKSEKETYIPNSEQLQEKCDMISDEDIQEISNMLVNLQTLATEVNKEQHEQMEKINSLISDVGKTELRMKADIKDIKKMI